MEESLGERTVHFVKDVRAEVRKVVWPSWQRTGLLTVSVAVVVVVIALIIFLADLLFHFLLGV